MIYLQVAYLQSSIFDPTYRGPYRLYDRGTFDFESWACQVSGYKNNFPSRQCSSARAGRVADIICCITAIVTTVIGTRALRGERDAIKRAENEKRNRKNFWLHGSASSNDIEMDWSRHKNLRDKRKEFKGENRSWYISLFWWRYCKMITHEFRAALINPCHYH